MTSHITTTEAFPVGERQCISIPQHEAGAATDRGQSVGPNGQRVGFGLNSNDRAVGVAEQVRQGGIARSDIDDEAGTLRYVFVEPAISSPQASVVAAEGAVGELAPVISPSAFVLRKSRHAAAILRDFRRPVNSPVQVLELSRGGDRP